MLQIPAPPVYRRKKYALTRLNRKRIEDGAPFQIVPRFFDFYHPSTIWLISAIRTENEKELNRVLMDKQAKRLLQFEPDKAAIQRNSSVLQPPQKDFVITKAKYFQILDRPEYYGGTKPPLFGRHTVMYLTPLGLAIYLNKPKAVRLLVEHIDRDTTKKLVLARQPQFISYMNCRFGDLMCMFDHNLAMLNETYDILALMLANGNWFPIEPFRLLYRKRFVETYSSFDDFMEYAFYLLFTRRSSLNIPSLCSAVLRFPSRHFEVAFLCQPTKARRQTLLRDTNRIINNCKSFPRRLLRCAYYADKKMKSSVNLVRGAEIFIRTGIFKLIGEPSLPFVSKSQGERRLEKMVPYQEKERSVVANWPNCYFEFDADCCLALLIGLMAKCHHLGKTVTFRATLNLAIRLMSDTGWLNHFDTISDLEFKDYFTGLEDSEKVNFSSEAFGFLRQGIELTVIDQRFDLSRFFNDGKLELQLLKSKDLKDPVTLSEMIRCRDDVIMKYATMQKGEQLRTRSTIISGNRTRGEGRDDPNRRARSDNLGFSRLSIRTLMSNAANADAPDEDGEDDDGRWQTISRVVRVRSVESASSSVVSRKRRRRHRRR